MLQPDHVDVLLEADARMRGIGGLVGGKIEQKHRIRFTAADPDSIRAQLKAQLPS